MMGILSGVVLIALGVWLAKGAPRRPRKLTDQEIIEQRQRAEMVKRQRVIDRVNKEYHQRIREAYHLDRLPKTQSWN